MLNDTPKGSGILLHRLRRRLSVLCAFFTGAILCLMSILLLRAFERELDRSARTAFDGYAASIAYRLLTEQRVDWDWLSQMEQEGRLLIRILDNGEPLRYPGAYQPATQRGALLDAVQQALSAQTLDFSPSDGSRIPSGLHFTLRGLQGEPYLAAALPIPSLSMRTLILVQEIDVGQRVRLRAICIGLSAAGVLLLALFSWRFTGRALSPVAEGIRQQNEFIAAASHELRSPLAVIQANAAALAVQADEGGRPFAKAIERECARTGRLVADLLLLASSDGGRLQISPAPVEPEELIRIAEESFRTLAKESGIALEIRLPSSPLPILAGDEQRLCEVLGILIDNALTYTPQGGRIELGAFRNGAHVCLCVSDNGPGMSETEKAMAMQRFFRGDGARSAKGHYGLGLPIAADLIKRHGGKIHLRDAPGGGLCAECALPIPNRR